MSLRMGGKNVDLTNVSNDYYSKLDK